ncbi:CASP7 [Lepeophtheirus salmonis]|uniref:CASP7 n=1 Tax=Lepeophtheirus salmonis TaxID=72036 RepID=A0A7R8CTS2_LEPSM|nr:CASP7 [Lepeophtheirus salmonis]CAF2928243.1 CASP7 [Lepeophtheirus salmonis]
MTLWRNYLQKKIPSLAGKPKVIFVQGCQGSKTDKGILIKYEMSRTLMGMNISGQVHGHGSAVPIHKISTHADFLLAKSSYHGYYSYRSNTSGSWFIQTVCDEICRASPMDDLLSIMTKVIRNISLNYTSHHEDPDIDQCKTNSNVRGYTSQKDLLEVT